METIEDILNHKGRDVWTVPDDISVLSALELMATHNVGAVPVTDDDGRIVGMFSERDFARLAVERRGNLPATPVQDVMAKKVVMAGVGVTVEECMTLMTRRRIRHMPVVEDGELVGLVSIGDVVNAAIHDKDLMIEQLEHYITGSL
jgi:CBS domain-containing protein